MDTLGRSTSEPNEEPPERSISGDGILNQSAPSQPRLNSWDHEKFRFPSIISRLEAAIIVGISFKKQAENQTVRTNPRKSRNQGLILPFFQARHSISGIREIALPLTLGILRRVFSGEPFSISSRLNGLTGTVS